MNLHVRLRAVGPRDGLQMAKGMMPDAGKWASRMSWPA